MLNRYVYIKDEDCFLTLICRLYHRGLSLLRLLYNCRLSIRPLEASHKLNHNPHRPTFWSKILDQLYLNLSNWNKYTYLIIFG